MTRLLVCCIKTTLNMFHNGNTVKKTILFLLLFSALFLNAASHDVRLFTIDGVYYNSKKVRKQIATKYIVVDFFSSTCPPCIKSLPKLEKLYKKYHSKGLQVVVVAQPAGFDSEKIEKQKLTEIASTHKISFPLVFDMWQKAAERYKVGKDGSYDVPQYFILNKKGEIVFTSRKFKELAKEIVAIMK